MEKLNKSQLLQTPQPSTSDVHVYSKITRGLDGRHSLQNETPLFIVQEKELGVINTFRQNIETPNHNK